MYLNLNLFKNQFYVLYLLTDKNTSIKFIAACYNEVNIKDISNKCMFIHTNMTYTMYLCVYVCMCAYMETWAGGEWVYMYVSVHI